MFIMVSLWANWAIPEIRAIRLGIISCRRDPIGKAPTDCPASSATLRVPALTGAPISMPNESPGRDWAEEAIACWRNRNGFVIHFQLTHTIVVQNMALTK